MTVSSLKTGYDGVSFLAGNSAFTPAVRALIIGGFDNSIGYNTVDYVDVGTTGNATDFGDLTATRWAFGACGSSTRAVVGGGNNGGGNTACNIIEYFTI